MLCCLLLPIVRFLWWAKNIHLILVLTLVEKEPFQLEFLSHLGQPSCSHPIDVKLTMKVYVLPLLCCLLLSIIRFLWWAKNFHLILVLTLVGKGPFQIEFLSLLGLPSASIVLTCIPRRSSFLIPCFQCGQTWFSKFVHISRDILLTETVITGVSRLSASFQEKLKFPFPLWYDRLG